MALSNDLLSQFAKITKDTGNKKTESIVYGTIVENNDLKYVQIDGSDIVTPISDGQFATNIADGDRVTVMIKNHMATVTGNVTSPSARGKDVEAGQKNLQTQIEKNAANITLAVTRTVGGRNYILGTATPYTATSNGAAREWLYPWPCASADIASSLFGKTVTVSFDYESSITSGVFSIWINVLWKAVATFDSNSGSGHFEKTMTLDSASINNVNIIYIDGTWNGSVTFSNFKMEVGDMATDWSPAYEDPVSSVVAGSSVIINEHEILMSTEKFEVKTVNAAGQTGSMRFTPDALVVDRIDAGNVPSKYDGPSTIYVDPNATSEQIASGEYYKQLADVLVKINNHWLTTDVVIRMAGGMSEYGELMITGIVGGGCLYITSDSTNHAKLYGVLRIRRCSAEVDVTYLDVTVPNETTLAAFIIRSCSYVCVAGCSISAVGTCFHISRGANVMADSNTMRSSVDPASGYVMYGGRAHFHNNIGSGKLLCDRGVMTVSGTVPAGGVSYIDTFEPNNVNSVVPTGADGTPSIPIIYTATYAMANADSYAQGNVDSWNYNNDDDIRQGYTEHAGRIYGCIWFNNAAIQNGLSGKTINQASIRLTAQKYVGRGAAVSVHLHGISTEYVSRSGVPTIVKDYGIIGTIEPGVTTNLSIPTAVISDLVAGTTVKGLALYSDDTAHYRDRNYSENYAKFDGATSGDANTRPLLTVIYQ